MIVETFDDLVRLMDRLRDPETGCPWDLEQSYRSLRSYLIEECYEVVEALDREDRGALAEELGDLLFQIVFLSRLAQEEGAFTALDVVRGIGVKMVRRHPHVFGDADAADAETVLRNWEEIKRHEKAADAEAGGNGSILSGIPRALPALPKAQRLGTKAARVGFDWPDADGVLDKLDEEVRELRAAMTDGDPQRLEEELGDLLFAVAMLGRKLEVDPERALERANAKFARRFADVERALLKRGVSVEDAGLELLERLWNEAKAGGR